MLERSLAKTMALEHGAPERSPHRSRTTASRSTCEGDRSVRSVYVGAVFDANDAHGVLVVEHPVRHPVCASPRGPVPPKLPLQRLADSFGRLDQRPDETVDRSPCAAGSNPAEGTRNAQFRALARGSSVQPAVFMARLR
jgi:hypothetical protein